MLTTANAYRLAAETNIDPRTIQRAYRGERVVPGHHAAIELAAERLGIELPPPNPPRAPAKAGVER